MHIHIYTYKMFLKQTLICPSCIWIPYVAQEGLELVIHQAGGKILTPYSCNTVGVAGAVVSS